MQSFLLLADGGVAYAVTHSDFVGNGICAILIVYSVIIWVIMVEKLITLCHADSSNAGFIRQFNENKNPLHLKESVKNDPSPAARIYQAACSKIDVFRIEYPGGRRAMNNDELDILRGAMEQEVERQILFCEKRTMFLATAVSGCPFLGLFGTVWGIMIAFTNLAMLGHANIQTLAPGVSGALLTTVVALLVAIPSLIGYNIIGGKIRVMTAQLDNFTEEVIARFKIEQMESIQASQNRK